MTLGKHRIDGVQPFGQEVVASSIFEKAMLDAGYQQAGSIPTHAGRTKIWWVHKTYARVESIYDLKKAVVITAYHS